MGEDGTPEETSGTTPTPPEAAIPDVPAPEPGAEPTLEPTPDLAPPALASDATQEIPIVPAEPPAGPPPAAPVSETAQPGSSPEPADEPSPEAAAAEDAAPADEPNPEAAAAEDAAPAAAPIDEPAAEHAAEDAPTEAAPPDTPTEETAPTGETAPIQAAPTPSESATEAGVTGPAHAAPGGRSLWRPILAVVASLAILAGVAIAGYAYGRSTAPGPDIVVQQEPVTEQPADAEAMPVNVMPSMVAPILAVRNEAIGAPTAVLTAAAGLEDTPGTAMGFRLVNSGISGGQIASVLATAFGVRGSTIQQGDTWSVGKEGGPQVVVTDDALFSWVFRDPDKLANPSVGQQLEPADSIDLANTLLSSIGVDTSSVDWQVDRYFDRTAVTAWQVIADQRTQLRWLVAFDPEGAVVEAGGFSAGLEPVASYPVVGAATAVQRSNTPPWWTLGATLVAPAPDGATAPSVEPIAPAESTASPAETSAASAQGSPEPTPPPTSSPLGSDPVFGSEAASNQASPSEATAAASGAVGSPDTPTATQPGLVVRVDDVVVTEARLGLAQFWQPDGSVLMLPSYVLTGLDGSTWSLIAVADEYVAFVPSTDPLPSDSGQ